MDEKPRTRGRFQFSLTGVLACVTTCAIVLGIFRPWESAVRFPVSGDIAMADVKQIELLIKVRTNEPILNMRREKDGNVWVTVGTNWMGSTFRFQRSNGKWIGVKYSYYR